MKLVTTSVVRGSYQGESHGGVYLIDLEKREVRQTLDWNKADIDWQGRGRDRGLRGIAFDGEIVYIAASDELFAYTPDFELLGSWRNQYLKHCHEIAVWERRLFLTSTGFDSILGFDLDRREFSWAMHVASHEFRFKGVTFDPRGNDGPLMLNKLHINKHRPHTIEELEEWEGLNFDLMKMDITAQQIEDLALEIVEGAKAQQALPK